MIQVLCRKQPFILQHPRESHIKVTVDRREQIQFLPDWAAETETFEHGVRAGLIAILQPAAKTKPAGKGAN